jgi:hypothetical protein
VGTPRPQRTQCPRTEWRWSNCHGERRRTTWRAAAGRGDRQADQPRRRGVAPARCGRSALRDCSVGYGGGSRRSPSASGIPAGTRRMSARWRCSPSASFPVSRCHCRPKWCPSCGDTNATTRLANAFVQPLITRYIGHRGLNCAPATLPAMRDLLVDMASPDGTSL